MIRHVTFGYLIHDELLYHLVSRESLVALLEMTLARLYSLVKICAPDPNMSKCTYPPVGSTADRRRRSGTTQLPCVFTISSRLCLGLEL